MTQEELNKWLADEIMVYPGCCSSIECVKYDIAKETAIKMQGRTIDEAIEWLKEHAVNYYGVEGEYSSKVDLICCIDELLDDFKQAMEEV